MNLFIRWFASCLLATASLTSARAGDPAGPRLDFKEVYDLIKSQLPGVEEGVLDNAAARGLIAELEPRVQLVSTDTSGHTPTAAETIKRTRTFDGAYGYIRFGQLGPDSLGAFQSAWQSLTGSNVLKGLVLDMRFATGEDYRVAARLADQFFTTKEPLLDWGKGPEYSEAKTNAIDLPLTVLINRRTAGAAEAFAGILRYGIAALLIGSPTAGQASVYRDFTLTTGPHLRIAVQPVQVGGNQVSITVDGLKPDLLLTVAPEAEKAWLEDPYKVLSSATAGVQRAENESGDSNSSTSSAPRRRINEADLVRMLREGDFPDWVGEITPRATPVAADVIQDPALARALDFLKGLAVVRKFKVK
jgi:hypothetical protein